MKNSLGKQPDRLLDQFVSRLETEEFWFCTTLMHSNIHMHTPNVYNTHNVKNDTDRRLGNFKSVGYSSVG